MLARPEWNEPDRRSERIHLPLGNESTPFKEWLIGTFVGLLIMGGVVALFEGPVAHMLALSGM